MFYHIQHFKAKMLLIKEARLFPHHVKFA